MFWAFAVTLTLNTAIFSVRHSSLWWCIIRLSLVAKGSQVQKISFKRSCSDYMSPVTLTLKRATQFVLQVTPDYADVPSWSQKVQQLRRYCPANFNWNFELLLWSWPWAQQSNIFNRHFGLWRSSIKTNWLQNKLQQKQSYFDNRTPHCDLNHEHRNLCFSHQAPAYDAVSLYQVCLQKIQQNRRCHADKH